MIWCIKCQVEGSACRRRNTVFQNYAGRQRLQRGGWAFICTALNIAFAVITLFTALFPDVMPSTTSDAYSLTVHNASSSPYMLRIMSWVALVFTPIVLLYQGWTYWVFRRRIGVSDIPKA